jgi:hypothetical protein
MSESEALTGRIFEKVKAGREARVKAAAEATKPQIALKAVTTDEFGVITLIGAAAGSPSKIDLDEEFLAKADMIKMAFDFCSDKGRTFKANHSEPIDCALVESYVGAPIIKDGDVERTLKADEVFDPALYTGKVDHTKGSETHWFFSVKPSDPEVVEIAKAGGIAGASWGALVSKTEV